MSSPVRVKTGNPLTRLVEVEPHRLVANSTLALSSLSILIGANQPVTLMIDFTAKAGWPFRYCELASWSQSDAVQERNQVHKFS